MSATLPFGSTAAPARRLAVGGGLLLALLAVHALFGGGVGSAADLAILAAVALLVAAGTARTVGGGDPGLLGRAALLAGLYAAAVPLLPLAAVESLPRLAAHTPFWPPILVLVAASRLQAAVADARFRRFWRDPARVRGGARVQSLGAALCLGLAMTLALYAALGMAMPDGVPPGPADPWRVSLRALVGDTAVHQMIVALFFVLLAALLDGWLLLRTDEAVLAALSASLAGRPPGALRAGELAALARQLPGDPAETRALAWIDESCALPGAREVRLTLDGFHLAVRRLLRALLAFLPLLGFVGTVIGLAVAIGSLGGGQGGAEGGVADIGSSLAGLSIQFETTLLGLATGLVASLALAALERREAELRHACERLVEVCRRRDDP